MANFLCGSCALGSQDALYHSNGDGTFQAGYPTRSGPAVVLAAVDEAAVAATLADVTKLKGSVMTAAAGSLPNDGKVIFDEREYDT